MIFIVKTSTIPVQYNMIWFYNIKIYKQCQILSSFADPKYCSEYCSRVQLQLNTSFFSFLLSFLFLIWTSLLWGIGRFPLSQEGGLSNLQNWFFILLILWRRGSTPLLSPSIVRWRRGIIPWIVQWHCLIDCNIHSFLIRAFKAMVTMRVTKSLARPWLYPING